MGSGFQVVKSQPRGLILNYQFLEYPVELLGTGRPLCRGLCRAGHIYCLKMNI